MLVPSHELQVLYLQDQQPHFYYWHAVLHMMGRHYREVRRMNTFAGIIPELHDTSHSQMLM
jgi:hypothetical protein